MKTQRNLIRPFVVLAAAVVFAACGDPESTDVCADVSCGVGQCVERDGQATCECPAGHHAEGQSCVQDDLCEPNPCTEPNRSACRVEGDAAVCDCDEGYVLEDGACVPERVSCDGEHTEGDDFEPDECPGQARDIGVAGGQNEAHTLFPAGDHDWFVIASVPGRIYQARVDADVPVSLEFHGPQEEGQQGPPRLATQTGSGEVVLAVKAQTEQLLVRVRASSEEATGSYTIDISDEGLDDHGDDAASATAISATGTEESGRWQFTGDKDWLKFEAEEGHAYRFNCSTSGLANRCVVRLVDGEGNVLASDEEIVSILTWVAPTSMTVYVELALSNSGMADYTWKLDDLGKDDHGDDAASATSIVPSDEEHTGEWHISGDRDWLGFSAAGGHIYRFTCSSDVTSCVVRLVDDAGNELARHSGKPATITFKVRAPAVYYFEIARPESDPGTGTYTWKLEDLGADDHGDDAASATPVTADGITHNGKWEYGGDRDWLSFPAQAGHVYRIFCDTNGLSNRCDARLVDAAGNELVSENSAAVLITWIAPADGTYYLDLGLSNSGTADYTWRIVDLGGDDHGNDAASATLVSESDFGTEHQGAWLISGDTDWLRIEAEQGFVYRLTCTSNVSSHCLVRLVDASGNELDRDSATTSVIEFKASAAASYYFEITRPASDPGTGTYTWKVENLGGDDHGDDALSATPVTPSDDEQNARWEFANDKDWLTFTAAEGHLYRFTCSTSGTGNQCVVNLRDAAGTVLETQSSAFVILDWIAPADGEYFIELALSNSGTANYQWKLVDLGGDDHGNDTASATLVSPADFGTEHQGAWLISGDTDWFRIEAEQGDVYRMTCTSNVQSHCLMRLVDANGTELDRDSATTSVIEFKASSDASYYFEITRPTSNPGTGTYTWKLEFLGGDDHGDDALSATPVTPSADEQNARWEFANDKDWLKFTAAAGHLYRITCGTSGLGNQCVVNLRDAAGNVVETQTSSFVIFNWTAAADGEYFIELALSNSGTADYTWKLVDLGSDDHGNDAASATLITADQLGTDQLGNWELSGDIDWLKFEAEADHLYRFTCTSNVAANCVVRLVDESGNEIDVQSGTNASVSFRAATAATWFFEVSRPANNPGTGTYTWKLIDLGNDDHGNDINSATGVDPSDTARSASWEVGGDKDVMMFGASVNDVFRIICAPDDFRQRCDVKLYDEAGNALITDGSTYVSQTWRAPAAGRYFVEFSSSTSGTYKWTIRHLSTDEHGDDMASATVVTATGVETAGKWDISGDLDFLRFDAPESNRYRFTCVNKSGAACKITLRDASGAQLDTKTTTSTINNAASIERQVTAGATYYVEIARSTSGLGDYAWKIEDLGP